MERDHVLFSGGELYAVIAQRGDDLKAAVDQLSPEQVLNIALDALCDNLEDRFRLDTPTLRTDEIQAEVEDAQVDGSRDATRAIFDRTRPFYVPGTTITFTVPFDGDAELFRFRPNSYDHNPPHAHVGNGMLSIIATRTDHDATAAKAEFERTLQSIQTWLDRVRSMTDPFNAGLRQTAMTRLQRRRQKVLNDSKMADNLGYPLRHRDGSSTRNVPLQRKVIRSLPSVTPGSRFEPEPAIEAAIYDDILATLRGMSLLMERNPATFAKLTEPEIRDHFLLQLNGTYQGAATGETFNGIGKTDILIRAGDRNVFIAECKFWHGPKEFQDAIDQLLGYATWRDCKLALLVFNRNKDFTAVLAAMRDAVQKHPAFRRMVQGGGEIGLRCHVMHPRDPAREMRLTVLAFEVPVQT
jgi:hypothetical protein